MHDAMKVGGAGNRRGIGLQGRLVVGVWKEGGGREVEGDTLADVEDRLLRKEAFLRYQEWLRALWRGDEAVIVRGFDEKVYQAFGGGGMYGGVQISVLSREGDGAGGGAEGEVEGGEWWLEGVGVRGSPWASRDEEINPIEALALSYLGVLLVEEREQESQGGTMSALDMLQTMQVRVL